MWQVLATLFLSIIDVYGELKLVMCFRAFFSSLLAHFILVLTHIPINGVGSRQVRHSDLYLVRYDIPSWLPPPSSTVPTFNLETDKPRAPRISYSIHPPQTAIGPMDLVSIPLHLRPLEKDVSIRSASVVVERRLVLNDNPNPSLSLPNGLYTRPSNSSLHKPPSSPHLIPLSPNPSSSSASLPSLSSDLGPALSLHSSGSGSTITPDTLPSTPLHPSPINAPQQSSTKSIIHPIADAQSSGSFTRDQNGVFTKTLTLQWPSAKSRAHWAIGETITSDLVSVRFFLRTKVAILLVDFSSSHLYLLQIIVTSSYGTDTIELADKELYVVSTNEAERQLAVAKYTEQLETLSLGSATIRSKSKSPRRSKTEQSVDDNSSLPLPSEHSILPSLPKSPTNHNGDIYGKSRSTLASSTSAPARGGKSNRRPHTSAGPRDRPVNFAGAAYGRDQAETTRPGQLGGSPKGFGSGSPGTSTQSKRHSETIMQNVLNRPDYFENYAPMNKNASAKRPGTDNSSTKASSSKSYRLVSPSVIDMGNFFRSSSTTTSYSASSSGHSSAYSFGDALSGDSLSQTSEDLREWEEELARIEARSKESSVLFASAKKRKKSMDPSNNSHSNVVGVAASEESFPVRRVWRSILLPFLCLA